MKRGPLIPIIATLGFLFLYAPIVWLVVFSFNDNRLVTVWGGFTTRWYGELFQNEKLLAAAGRSLEIAAIAATSALVLGTLCAVSLGIGTFFWFQGAVLILPFAWLEIAAVGAAFLVYARHAADREHILLQGQRLVVELENAGRLERAEFNRDWVRVEPGVDDRSLIEVSGQGRRVIVGRYVRPELRTALAQEIRRALREA